MWELFWKRNQAGYTDVVPSRNCIRSLENAISWFLIRFEIDNRFAKISFASMIRSSTSRDASLPSDESYRDFWRHTMIVSDVTNAIVFNVIIVSDVTS